jgi:hypothetical protein
MAPEPLTMRLSERVRPSEPETERA